LHDVEALSPQVAAACLKRPRIVVPCPPLYPQQLVPFCRVTRRYEFPLQSPAVPFAGGAETDRATLSLHKSGATGGLEFPLAHLPCVIYFPAPIDGLADEA
jgi:hypothetical protein